MDVRRTRVSRSVMLTAKAHIMDAIRASDTEAVRLNMYTMAVVLNRLKHSRHPDYPDFILDGKLVMPMDLILDGITSVLINSCCPLVPSVNLAKVMAGDQQQIPLSVMVAAADSYRTTDDLQYMFHLLFSTVRNMRV